MDSKQIAEAMRLKLPVRYNGITYQQNFNRNYVAPRLTELKDIGVLETVGRRKATRSDATEAVWARKELPHEPR